MPVDAYEYLPGSFFTAFITSSRLRQGDPAATAMTLGVEAIMPSGTRSVAGLNPMLPYRNWLTVCVPTEPSTMV
ncbi:hypothetical protein G6F68_019251 [Rhizopus microsporus]|nr:hypothetical protein G6F68_019251 [Rhizopus microsporus]